jgi:uncharacterized protein (DUF697 family)
MLGKVETMTDTVADPMPDTKAPPAAAAPEASHEAAPQAATRTPEDEIEEAINKALDAGDVIKSHVIASMAVGLVPIPGVDLAGTLAIQVRMVHQICGIYDVTLRDNAAKTAVLSLLGSVMPVALAGGLVSGLKIIPGLGSLTGAAGVSLLGGAMTYAVGSVFQQHLESHDSLIDFDPTKVSSVMRREFDAGLTVARTLRGKVSEALIAKEKENAKKAASDRAGEDGDAAKPEPSMIRREFDAGISTVRSLGGKATRAFRKSTADSAAAETPEAAVSPATV